MQNMSNMVALLKHHKEKANIQQESSRLTEAQYQNLFKKLSELLNDAHKNGTPIMMHLAALMKEKDHGKKMEGMDKLHQVVKIHEHLNNQGEGGGGNNHYNYSIPQGGGYPGATPESMSPTSNPVGGQGGGYSY